MDLEESYKNCRLCPRQCGTNRVDGTGKAKSGFCGETHQLKVAYVGPHFGEEPPITGKRGSGTVFFTGCSLKCSFCQNFQISHKGLGKNTSLDELLQALEDMIRIHHVHNINFVTPDHFFPHTFRLVSLLREKALEVPVIYNMSGYQSLEMLRAAEEYADIYLPDFKYSDPSLAAELSKCRDYSHVAIEAIAEMVRQKGFLDACSRDSGPAKKGVAVRHLILPNAIENSVNALTTLFVEFGPRLPLSLMSQYHPLLPQKDDHMNRFISREEFNSVYSHALELGFENLFVQFPGSDPQGRAEISRFFPDFRLAEPFK